MNVTTKHNCQHLLHGRYMAAITALLLLTGCRTMDSVYRGTTKMVDPDRMQLQTDMKWLTPPTAMGLRPVSADRMVVYLRVKNTSGADLPDLYSTIRNDVEASGYRVTMDPAEAHYTLIADVRYFGETRTKDGMGSLLTGAALGGVAGAVVGHNVGKGYDLGGAAAGAVVGGAIGNIMANRNKMVEIALAVDLRIGERVNGGIRTTRKGSESASVGHADSVDVGGGGESGRASGGVSDEQQVEVVDDFLYHSNRIVVAGQKMGLTADEALPVLTGRVSRAVGSILP